MPEDKRRKHAVRDRMAAAGETYTTAARVLDKPYVHPDGTEDSWSISEAMQEHGLDYAGAVAWLEDPARKTMCEDCGWSFGMICPECELGCGCERYCSGWRHREFAGDDDFDDQAEDDYECECGAGHEYNCVCA
jgi:hypothetical protein